MVGRHAEIAGAGFAGLAAAIALRQRGWTVRIHEAERELRAFGAGIFIWENGLRILKSLGAYDAAVTGAHEAPLNQSRNERNETYYSIKFGPDRGTRMITMTRQHLFQALLTQAQKLGVDIETGSEALGAEPEGILLAAKGRKHRADLVVGADGVRSKIRDSLGQPVWREQYEQGVIRLLVDRREDDLTPVDRDYVINFWSGRYRLMYVPCNQREVYLLLGAHKSDLAATALPVRSEVYSEAFPFLAGILGRIGDRGRFDVYEAMKLTRWSVGRVAIVGDAAHSMPPTLGQGAGSAMANALSLAVALDQDPEIGEALAAWESRERPLTEHTQNTSIDHAQNRVGSGPRTKWDDEALRTARYIPTGTSP